MSSFKPLHTPGYRRIDRRSGVGTERLQDALSEPPQPWASDGERLGRESGAKRRAFATLSERYARSVPWMWRVAVLVGLVGASIAIWQSMSVAHELVPFAQNRNAYDHLVGAVLATCDAEPCSFGWAQGGDTPDSIRDAMARVRARSVIHDPLLAQVGIDGGYGVDPELVYRWAPTVHQDLFRALDARSRARADSARSAYGSLVTQTEDLGGGWTRTIQQ